MKFAAKDLPSEAAVLKRCAELEAKVNSGKSRDGPDNRLDDVVVTAALDRPSREHYRRYATVTPASPDPAATHPLYPCASSSIDVRLAEEKGRHWVAVKNVRPGRYRYNLVTDTLSL
jgi:hypothetical protein